MIRFVVPVATPNPLNGSQGRSRGAVFAKSARRKKQRNAARLATIAALSNNYWPAGAGILVDLTRYSAGVLDGDGLQAALKSVRDGVADALGVNDGSASIGWEYKQAPCGRGKSWVEVLIR